MHAREHRAVDGRGVAFFVAQITDVVEQRADDRELGAIRAQPVAELDAHLVARDEPHERERHVERVLHVVIRGVDRVIVRVEAAEHALEIVEGEPDGIERVAGVQRAKDVRDGGPHLRCRAHLHGVGHVVVVAPVLQFVFDRH